MKSLSFLLMLLFLFSCGDDDTTITPLCTTGDFSIQLDTTTWVSIGHLSEFTIVQDASNADVEEKELQIKIFGSSVEEQLVLTIRAFHLLSSGSDPHANGIEPKEYFVDPLQNSCTTTSGGSVDQCEAVSLNHINPGFVRVDSDGVNVGSLTITSCDKEEQKVSGSFDIVIENSTQNISNRVVGQFTDVCYSVQ